MFIVHSQVSEDTRKQNVALKSYLAYSALVQARGANLKLPLYYEVGTIEWPRLWQITDLSLVVNKQDQRAMKTAIKIFLAFPLF